MRHRVAHRKLGRKTEHRLATLRNLAAALFTHERIETTLFKAKELRPYAERMITRARRDSLHSRRLVAQRLGDRTVVKRLFDEIAPRFAERAGGYTRIIRTSPRRGDDAEMAIVELVVRKEKEKAPEKPAGKGAKAEKPEAAEAVAAEKKPAKPTKSRPAKAEKAKKAKKAAKPAKPAKDEKPKKAAKSAEKSTGGRRKASGGEGGRGGGRKSSRTPQGDR